MTGMHAVQGQDLVSGNLTAPAVYALQHPQYGAELERLIQNEFDGGATLERALELVHLGGGIQAARQLARQEADMVRLPHHTLKRHVRMGCTCWVAARAVDRGSQAAWKCSPASRLLNPRLRKCSRSQVTRHHGCQQACKDRR